VLLPTPAKTPMAPLKAPAPRPPGSGGTMPASSSAAQATSSRIRCCGSVTSAIRGFSPKKPASNASASARMPRALT
jgi:hypothetical protein